MAINIPLLTFLSILLLCGIAGNSLVFYIFLKTYALSTFRLFVIFLSAVDLFVCAFAIPLEMITLMLDYKNDIGWLCKLFPFVLSWPTITSVSLLLVIATDRYRKACTPFSWQFTHKAARNVFISCIFVSMGASILSPVMFGVRKAKHSLYNVTIFQCEITESMKQTPLPLINSIIFALLFFGSMTGITVLYICIAARVKQQLKRKHQMVGRHVHSRNAMNIGDASKRVAEKQKRNCYGIDAGRSTCNIALDSGSIDTFSEKKQDTLEEDQNHKEKSLTTKSRSSTQKMGTSKNRTTLVMFTVSSMFFISFVPSTYLNVTRVLKKGFLESLNDSERSVYKFFFRFYLLNSVINPVIYGIFDPHFRNSCKRLFCCKRP
ncbi:alpha-2A adrenergic receptor-like [Mercenaria mercenaria]|uniref:alpha-2A adrenergic receptor-like n=1 Tax=Mercenaria mercenaria TaxID=6596 RepID=UPI00234F2649|nr:alpha-2A adrenergic receptor-like [Mercenaria mercenaria]